MLRAPHLVWPAIFRRCSDVILFPSGPHMPLTGSAHNHTCQLSIAGQSRGNRQLPYLPIITRAARQCQLPPSFDSPGRLGFSKREWRAAGVNRPVLRKTRGLTPSPRGTADNAAHITQIAENQKFFAWTGMTRCLAERFVNPQTNARTIGARFTKVSNEDVSRNERTDG